VTAALIAIVAMLPSREHLTAAIKATERARDVH
jgi:hypothetical protein